MQSFNHWRRKDKKMIFAPKSVAEAKKGKKDFKPNLGTDCASCGSGCSGGGCSGSCLGD